MVATDVGYRAEVSGDGRLLAFAQNKFGRRPNSALHVIDLADGSRQTQRHWGTT